MKFTPSPFAVPRVPCDARANVLGLRTRGVVQLSASAIGAVGSTRVTDLQMTPAEARTLAVRLLEEADVVETYPLPKVWANSAKRSA